jgi:hypothetical protein
MHRPAGHPAGLCALQKALPRQDIVPPVTQLIGRRCTQLELRGFRKKRSVMLKADWMK